MADDSIKISVIQEVRNQRRNSICIPDSPDNGKTLLPPARRASIGHVGNNSRRNSSGKLTSPNNGDNIIPHYLRASTGSCHDLCKYGRKNANEVVKPWKIKPKRAVASSSEDQSDNNVLVGDRKKTTMVKLNTSPDPAEVIKGNDTRVVSGEKNKTIVTKLDPSPEPPEVIKQNAEAVVPRWRKKTAKAKLKPSTEDSKVIKQNSSTVVTGEGKKTAMLKLEVSPQPAEVIKQNNSSLGPGERKKTSTMKLKSSLESNTALVPRERKKTVMGKLKSSCHPPEVIKREISVSSKKVDVSLKRDSSSAKTNSDKDLKMSQKRSPSLKANTKVVMPSSSSDASLGPNGRRKSEEKSGNKMGPVKAVAKKFLVIPTVSLSPKSPVSKVLSSRSRKGRNLKQVSPLKDQNQMPRVESAMPCNDKVHEKILHIAESDSGNSISVSLQTEGIVQSLSGPPYPPAFSPKSSPHANSQGSYSERDDLEYTLYTNSEDEGEEDDYISENDEIVNPSGLETLQGDDKKLRKGKPSVPEGKDAAAAVKLKFRRGRIVDVQSENNSSPRKLRFRRGIVLAGKDDHSGSKRRIYKKRGDNETKDSDRLGDEKIVLKHQDVQGKKDSSGLFNNVIEETASKLVETRKSKVKALVGAFETVISLQDSKPSSQTVT